MFEPLNHHPGAIAIGFAGIITFLGLVGVGEILCHLAGFRIREPWRAVLASLTGMLAVSLAVQLAAMLGGVPRSGWSVAWGVLAAIGLCQGRKWISMAGVVSRRVTWGDPFLLVAIAANAITFAVALAPSSKADELYYHMLVPQRLLQDGGLVFYRSPWQSAILPQMPYQLLQVVLHAIGVADAANVMSWCFAILLQVLVSSVASRRGAPAWWGSAATACASVGMIPVVWHVTAGAHAVGNLASAALILAASPIAESLGLSGLDRTRRLVLAGICGAAAVATKVTLIPLVAACLGWLVVSEWRGSKASSLGLSRLIAACLLPGLVFLGPIALFTAVESGSPLGIVGAGWFGPSSYEASEATRVLAQVRRVNSVSVGQFLIQALMDYSPVWWLAALANIVIPPRRRFRAYWALISAVTIGVIVLVTQNDVRFFAGYPFAAIALARAAAWMQCSKSVRCFQVVATMAVVPWLGAMAYYSAPFVRCTAGMDSREDFLKERTAFREDFVALDQLLPPEAVLLVDGGRLNSVSAPRRVVCDVRDLRTDQGVYLLSIGNDAVAPAGFELGPAVYDNQNAVIAAYRRPGASPLRGELHVYALKAHDATSGR